MTPVDFETTISINGHDVDVVLSGNYIPKTACNDHDGFCEYEGHEIEDMTVECNGIDITAIIPDDALEKLNRVFSNHCRSNLFKMPSKSEFRSMLGHYFHTRGGR
jgi:hypothetical protein